MEENVIIQNSYI